MSVDMTGRDVIHVELENGQEVRVYNSVVVQVEHNVNSINGYETFYGSVLAGDGSAGPPAAVTERIADLLWDEFNLDVKDQGIEVVDPDDEEVDIL